jgi:hypothetical protein
MQHFAQQGICIAAAEQEDDLLALCLENKSSWSLKSRAVSRDVLKTQVCFQYLAQEGQHKQADCFTPL